MNDSAPALDTACPRCGGAFHCGVNDGHCACFGLRLSEALQQHLSATYPGQCLCVTCLAELSQPDACPAPVKTLTAPDFSPD